MTQEVQIVLTLEVDASKSKEEIKRFFLDMEETYTQTVSSKNRWEFPKITLIDIKEESEIYKTETKNNQINNSKYFAVSGFWKDDKVKFEDFIIKELDIVDDSEDIEIFYYGLSEEDIKSAINLKWKTDFEFVITNYNEILIAIEE
jgi:hypothetical protein